ncbi:aldo/keto reductase [Gammaproteobacteria bacterium]|nr:aldo/keto reductase [Gammaproteobacteria bacterium]
MSEDFLPIDRVSLLGELDVSRIAYGCWRFAGGSTDTALAKINAALDTGINVIDTAPIYGYGETGFGDAEEKLGAVLARKPSLRQKMAIVTKAGIDPLATYDCRAEQLIASCESSLKRLRTDFIDVFLIHRPDLLTSHEAVAEALDYLMLKGHVRAIGVSNYSAAQMQALDTMLDTGLHVTQPQLSALCPDALFDGSNDTAQELSLTTMAWSPLGGGAIATGKSTTHAERLARLMPVLDRIAAERNCLREHLALAWVLALPDQPIAIIGSQQPERINAAVKALDVKMTRRDWYDILEASLGFPMP